MRHSALVLLLLIPASIQAQEDDFIPTGAKKFSEMIAQSEIPSLDKNQIYETAWGGEIQYSFEMEGRSKKIFKWYGPKNGVINPSAFKNPGLRGKMGTFLRDSSQFPGWDQWNATELSQRVRWKDLTLTGREAVGKRLGYTGMVRMDGAPKEITPRLTSDLGAWEIMSESYARTPAELFKVLDQAAKTLGSRSVHVHVSFPKPREPRMGVALGSWVTRLDMAMHLRYLARSPHAVHRNHQEPYNTGQTIWLIDALANGEKVSAKYHHVGMREGLYKTENRGEERIGFEIRAARSLWDIKATTLLATQRLKDGRFGPENAVRSSRFLEETYLQFLVEGELQRRNLRKGDAFTVNQALSGTSVTYRDREGKRASLNFRIAVPVMDWTDSIYVSDRLKKEARAASQKYLRRLTDLLLEMKQAEHRGNLNGQTYGEKIQQAVHEWGKSIDLATPMYDSVVNPGEGLPSFSRSELEYRSLPKRLKSGEINIHNVEEIAGIAFPEFPGINRSVAERLVREAGERTRFARGRVNQRLGEIGATMRGRDRATRH